MQASTSATLVKASGGLHSRGPFSAGGVIDLPEDCDRTCRSSACGVSTIGCPPGVFEGGFFGGLSSWAKAAKLAAAISVVNAVPNHFIQSPAEVLDQVIFVR